MNPSLSSLSGTPCANPYSHSCPSTETCDSTSSPILENIPPSVDEGYFAFAKIKNEICLVQVSSLTPITALSTVDIKIFRHEFITIFRLLEARTMHPDDVYIIETIDDRLKCYEEEKETVFLAKEVVQRMRKLSPPPPYARRHLRMPSQARRGYVLR